MSFLNENNFQNSLINLWCTSFFQNLLGSLTPMFMSDFHYAPSPLITPSWISTLPHPSSFLDLRQPPLSWPARVTSSNIKISEESERISNTIKADQKGHSNCKYELLAPHSNHIMPIAFASPIKQSVVFFSGWHLFDHAPVRRLTPDNDFLSLLATVLKIMSGKYQDTFSNHFYVFLNTIGRGLRKAQES